METPTLPPPIKPLPAAVVDAVIPRKENTHWHARVQYLLLAILLMQCPQIRGYLPFLDSFFPGASALAAAPGTCCAPPPEAAGGRIVAFDPRTRQVAQVPLASVEALSGKILATTTNGGASWAIP